jgi:hypothetical protein
VAFVPGSGPDVVFHWDNIGLDGPVIPALRGTGFATTPPCRPSPVMLGIPLRLPSTSATSFWTAPRARPPAFTAPINLISSLAFENVIVCAPELVCRGGRHGEQDLRLDNRAVLSRSSEDALAFGTPIHPAADQQLREQPNYSASGLSPKGLNGTVP